MAPRGTDETLALTNPRVAALLSELADLLDIRGDSAFKAGAYRRAADVVARAPVEVLPAYRAGHPPPLPGVGRGIAARLEELARSGRIAELDALRAEVPPGVASLLRLTGVGPRTAGDAWRALGIASLDELEAAARAGRLRRIRGIGAEREARILESLEQHRRRPSRRLLMGDASALAARLVDLAASLPAIRSATIAGSTRRGVETVGDLDLLVETDDPSAALEQLLEVIPHEAPPDQGPATPGTSRASLLLREGPQLDVMTAPSGRLGSYLVHFTGSAAHNVRLRQRAKALGGSLSEHGLAPVDGPAAPRVDGAVETFPTEAALYERLGLPPIDPELREDRGEIEAAESGALPRLVTRADLMGDCHSHSDWSDGRTTLEAMVASARSLGLAWLVLTDHSWSLTIANGLGPDRVEAQRRIVGELNERFARERARGEAPSGEHPDGFRLLHGCELEITIDGRLDFDDGLLERFDVVVASLHVGRRQPRDRLMERYGVALRSPHVDIIAHPSGRKIGRRPDLDLDWDRFYRLAAETGTLLEVNGSEERLDLDEERIRAAREAGCRFVIDSDAHDPGEWQHLVWGTTIARRAWLEADLVANTRPAEEFLAGIRERVG